MALASTQYDPSTRPNRTEHVKLGDISYIAGGLEVKSVSYRTDYANLVLYHTGQIKPHPYG